MSPVQNITVPLPTLATQIFSSSSFSCFFRELHQMDCKGLAIGMLMLIGCATLVSGFVECSPVGSLMSVCSSFLNFGAPEPTVGSPCCKAVLSLNSMAASTNDRKDMCRCLVALMTTYNPNVAAVARLPALCGVYLGFSAQPNIDCNRYSFPSQTPVILFLCQLYFLVSNKCLFGCGENCPELIFCPSYIYSFSPLQLHLKSFLFLDFLHGFWHSCSIP